MILEGEKVIGLDFTAAECDSMRDGLRENLQAFQALRKIHLENRVLPALLFNPLPPDFVLPQGPSNVRFTPAAAPRRPADLEELAFASVGELAALIKKRLVTSEELTFMFLHRLKKYDPTLHCVVTYMEERALNRARQADAEIRAGKYRGPLHGIPCGIKDLLSTKGYKTTWGSVPFKDQMFDEDATVVRKLEEAGAVILAKTAMGELAWGDVWFGGRTRNPWNPESGSSGSSAGSASAVSAGLLPFAIGTETYGSIVSPASICGVTGLRPSYGRVSRTGAMTLSWSMDKIGVLCRTAEDAVLVLDAIRGPDGLDPTVYDAPLVYQPSIDVARLRIGYLVKEFALNYPGRANDSLSLEVLKKMGAKLAPLQLPDVPVSSLSFILDAEAAAAFDELTRDGRDSLLVRQIKNAWPNVFRLAHFIPAVDYINANRVRTQLIEKMAILMRQVDLFVGPSREGDNMLLTNLSGHPSITIPNGFTADGLPTSITLTGELFDEGTLVAVAARLQSATGIHQKHPALVN